jgi:hypothetical protein
MNKNKWKRKMEYFAEALTSLEYLKSYLILETNNGDYTVIINASQHYEVVCGKTFRTFWLSNQVLDYIQGLYNDTKVLRVILGNVEPEHPEEEEEILYP